MKKLSIILLLIIFILSIILILCYNYNFFRKASTLNATIKNFTDTYILVNGIDCIGNYTIQKKENIKIYWKGKKLTFDDLDVGDKILISYTDEIINASSPAPLSEVKSITLLDDSIEMNRENNEIANRQYAIKLFNNQFLMYTDRQKGPNIRALINTLISSNRENIKKDNHIVSFRYDGFGSETKDIYIVPDANDIKEQELLDWMELIDKEHFYYVETQTGDNEFINEIIVHY